MNLLQMQNGTKQFGTKVLFDGASFAINSDEHVGVIGPNGAGKTTLFKILSEKDELDGGLITRSNGLRIGYLEQEADWALDISAEEHLTQSCTKPIWELKQMGRDLGLTDQHFTSPLRSLSGGYRMRVKLLYLIGREPNLMLLDEPTNFLDLESVLALESFLQNYSGAFLLISHDREFLRRTTEYTLEVEGGDITKFPGNIDDYFEQKVQLRSVLEAQATSQALKRKQIEDFVSRFGAKATKARQAQSRLKQLEKMDAIELKELPVRARIRIPPPIHTGRESLHLEKADLGYDHSRPILKSVDLRLERGVHVGVVGVNGAGKSTLLKSLAQQLPLLTGALKLGHQVGLSYFSQHSADQLHANETVLEALQRAAHRELDNQEILNMAGSLLFSGDDVNKKIQVLSGGEKSRVALGQILLARSPLLLLDEPTNHLDFDTMEALTVALKNYEGTIVVVSHDRGFIGRIANRILEIRSGRVDLYPGSYDEYVWSVQKGALSEREESREADSPKTKPPENKSKASTPDSKKAYALARELERQMKKTEKSLLDLNLKHSQLNEELMSTHGPAAAQLAQTLGDYSQQIAALEDQLLQQMEELEDLKKV